MEKYRFLGKNIGVLTLSSMGTKLLNFLLVPLYTHILTTEEYGTYDLLNTTIAILIPLLTLNIADALLRFAMEKKVNKAEVFSISCLYLAAASGGLGFMLIINHFAGFFVVIDKFAFFFFLLFVVQAFAAVMQNFARSLDKFSDLAISSLLSTAVIILSNILLLVVFPWGIQGYLLAYFLGPLVQIIYLFARTKGWQYLQPVQNANVLRKEMMAYSVPLIFNSIGWWINSAFDRYAIIALISLAENGIYSIASKIPAILNIFTGVFRQAWSVSAVKEFDSEDKNGFFSNMYNIYNCTMVFACSVLIVFNKSIAGLIYAKEFYAAWRYVPFLIMATLFSALSGYVGGIFSAVKATKIFAQSAIAGAVVNIGLNLVLIPHMGAMGAAVATMISYWVAWQMRMIQVRKYIKLRIRIWRDYCAYAILILLASAKLMMQIDGIVSFSIAIVAVGGIIILYFKEILTVGFAFKTKFVIKSIWQ